MKLTYDERPSAVTAALVRAHAHRVGRLAVPGVATCWSPLPVPSVSSTQQFAQEKSVQLQDAQVRVQGTNGRTAQAIGMAQSPIVSGVKASGVPPRGRPV
jgi:hypothetical protein